MQMQDRNVTGILNAWTRHNACVKIFRAMHQLMHRMRRSHIFARDLGALHSCAAADIECFALLKTDLLPP